MKCFVVQVSLNCDVVDTQPGKVDEAFFVTCDIVNIAFSYKNDINQSSRQRFGKCQRNSW